MPAASASEVTFETEPLTDLTLTVFRVHGALLEWGDALVRPLGLTSARWQVLGAIALAGRPLTAPQVAQAMGITRQGVQKQLNLLADAGLLQAHDNPAHSRSPLHALTRKGTQTYQRAEKLWNARIAEVARHLPASRAATAKVVLDSLMHHLARSNKELP